MDNMEDSVPDSPDAANAAGPREAALREILQVISQSRDDTTPVFDVLLRAAQRLCHASNGAIVLGEEGDGPQTLAAQTGASEETLARYASGGFQMDPRESLAAQAIVERKTLHFPDITKGAPYLDGMKAVRMHVEKEGIRSSIYVPLISNGRGIGCLNLLHKEQRAYSPDEIALVESFAAQAVIAIENTRQFRELQTRLEREKASAEILSVISRSRDDEQPVFDVILRKASKLCNSTSAGLVLGRKGDKGQTLAAHLNSHPEIPEIYADGKYPMDPEVSAAAKAIIEGRVIHLEDMKDSDAYRQNHLQTRRMVDHHGVRTNLLVPLLSTDGGIGALILFKQEVSPYTDDEIALVEAFAAQAVIAIENVRQFRELQTRLEREAATSRILSVISQSPDDESPVFDAILESASRLCNAPLTFLSLANDERTQVSIPAYRGARPDFAATINDFHEAVEGSELIAVRPVSEGAVIRIDDLADSELYRQRNPWRVNMVELEGIRSVLVVPLMRGDLGIGGIVLYRREVSPFSEEDVALVETFAAQAVIAIENVRQFKALEARTEEVQALNASLEERVEAQVGEIERMGRLKRFLPAAVADTVVSSGSDKMLSSHRALLGVLFCDIRGFTAFCETAEPEETIEVLQTYHQEMGRLINNHGAGVDHRMGDGIMVLFNDPLPCDDPAGEAVRLALAMRDRMEDLCKAWKRLGHRLGFGVGVSLGYATVGMVGYEGRYDYTASGTAVNIAARLCDHAEDGEILLSPRAWTAVEDRIGTTARGEVSFKGINREIEVMCIEPGAVLTE